MSDARNNASRSRFGICPLFPCAIFSAVLALTLVLTLSATPASAASCPNEALRESQTSEAYPAGTTGLPQCMALELVSPPKKFNQKVGSPQFSANGERVMFDSLAALADTPRQGSIFDRYVAGRGATGWQTQAMAPPFEIIVGSGSSALPCSFAPDLSRWALFGSTSIQASLGITTAFQGGLGGLFSPLGPTMVPITGVGDDPTVIGRGSCEGASQDVSRFYFALAPPENNSPGLSYLPGDPVPLFNSGSSGVGRSNVYEAYLDEGIPTVRLLQRDHNGTVYGGSCGVRIGSPDGGQRGAVSTDASRIYFTTNPSQPAGSPCDKNAHPHRIMQRLETPAGPEITELVANECTRVSPACSSVDGDDTFRGASQEGGKVYFTTTRQLADSDLDTGTQCRPAIGKSAGCDLYLYDSSRPPGSQLIQVSAGDGSAPTPGEGAEVLGVADFSGDGTHVYFVATGILTMSANAAGDTAEAGQPSLYLYQRDAEFSSGRTVFVARLATGETGDGAGVPMLGPDFEDQSIGGDGHVLLFGTAAALTPDDTDGGHHDLYRYDADTDAIERISKAAPGGQDNGPFAANEASSDLGSGGPQTVSFGRSISEDGKTIAFLTGEQLDPADTDGGKTLYIWRDGKVSALPFANDSRVVTATVSMSGEEVAFVSSKRLVPEDGDSAVDVYVARADGGFPPPPPPVPCAGEACQEPFAAAPTVQGTASQATTTGNVKSTPCKRGTVRRRGRCVKRHARKAKQRQAKQKIRQANRSQGGSK